MKFTQAIVNKLKCPPEHSSKDEFILWDDELPRFGIRFRSGKNPKWHIGFHVNGRDKKMSLGKVEQIPLDTARTEAKKHFALVAQKIDPSAERAKVVARQSGRLIHVLIPEYLEHLENGKKNTPSYIAANKRSLEKRAKVLHNFLPFDVDRAMIASLLKGVSADRGPIAATDCRAHLQAFWWWMIGEGQAEVNPVEGTNHAKRGIRDRVLSKDELRAIWLDCVANPGEFSTIVRLLMLTAARRTQIGDLRKHEIIGDKIDLPGVAGRSKNKERFILPLSTQAKALLDSVESWPESEYVFGRTRFGGFSGWSKDKATMDKRLGLAQWGFHDFRRSFNTFAIDCCGVLPHVADACLSHKQAANSGVSRHYNFAQYLNEKVAAMQAWGDFVEGLVKPDLRLVA